MAYNDNAVNEEQIASFLADAVKSVEGASVADIDALNEIKKLFKKNVPFSKRKYVAAWLVKQAGGRRFGRSDRSERFNRDRSERSDRSERFSRDRNDRTSRAEARPARDNSTEREEHPHTPRVQIDPSKATTIFISIGRNRRVFPRDLLGLLNSVAGIDRDRVGDIKVLTPYSSVQLYTEDCEKVISKLNGYDYRGRTLTVSYSNKGKDGETAEVPSSFAEENQASADSGSEVGSSAVSSAVDSVVNEEAIPANVTNTAHADTSVNTEAERLAAEQSEFAARQSSVSSGTANDENIQPFFETADDGQVKSRFGNID
ncbi:MAG TPA: hypothetical protein DCM57_06495 [Treponema sp.]|nr:hypothetical protein [Treponema sp.]